MCLMCILGVPNHGLFVGGGQNIFFPVEARMSISECFDRIWFGMELSVG